MHRRDLSRIGHMLSAIADLRLLIQDRNRTALDQDRFVRAAFERFVEIISEASRHVSEQLKATEPQIPWRQIADTGNQIRHLYHKVDAGILWSICETELGPLESALHRIKATVSAVPEGRWSFARLYPHRVSLRQPAPTVRQASPCQPDRF